MTRVLLVSAISLLCVAWNASAATELAITISQGCVLRDDILQTARTETVRIWARARVNVRWLAGSDLPYTSPSNWLVVQCVAHDEGLVPQARVVPIAGIRFVDLRPTNTIVVSIQNAERLLDRDVLESRLLGERFRALRDRRLGRMLGRAIAHEIGHFLSASVAHASTGLMRATHPVSDLIGESLRPFAIGASEIQVQTVPGELTMPVQPGQASAHAKAKPRARPNSGTEPERRNHGRHIGSTDVTVPSMVR
jgi:hypothetical protein